MHFNDKHNRNFYLAWCSMSATARPPSAECLTWIWQIPIRIFYFFWMKYKADCFVEMIYKQNWQLIRIH